MKWNIPNILTLLRLIAAPGVAVMFLYFTRPYADALAMVLFIAAAVTDWFDGYLARAWGQETKLGAMLDPIADKAMVVIALMVIVAFSSWSPWLVLPATVILFREVFVSGLREYLGDVSGTLKVTRLANPLPQIPYELCATHMPPMGPATLTMSSTAPSPDSVIPASFMQPPVAAVVSPTLSRENGDSAPTSSGQGSLRLAFPGCATGASLSRRRGRCGRSPADTGCGGRWTG